jgi:hypothetical protein
MKLDFWLRHQPVPNKNNKPNNKPLNLVGKPNNTRKANNNNTRAVYKPMPIRRRKSTRKNRKLY